MSTSVATETRVTPEELLAMPDGKSYELVDGQLVERSVGMESSWVGTQLVTRLDQFCRQNRIGWVFQSDTGYQCFSHEPSRVRKPDASLVRYGRLPGEILPRGWCKIAPDLVVEVVSPNDTVDDLEDKLEDYRKVAVPLIWVIYPRLRTARIHHADGSTSYLHEHEELTGGDLIPGFRCPLREIFPHREPAPNDQPARPPRTVTDRTGNDVAFS